MKSQIIKKAGEKFIFQGQELTAKAFCGPNGIEYPTAILAQKYNPKASFIGVINVEHGGMTKLEESIKKND